jgi:pyridoxamine 5'-phosphate oxidase
MTDGDATATIQDESPGLTSGDLIEGDDPFALFAEWLEAATASEPNDPTAMALATVDASGLPDGRKGEQLAATGKAALCFHWKSLRRQVRVRGRVEPVSPGEADAYFASRPRLSRIGAWASRQSRPLESRFALEKAVAMYTARFAAGAIPRPPHWSGFLVVPQEIEFWRDGAFRLHDRVRFARAEADGWTRTRLFP